MTQPTDTTPRVVHVRDQVPGAIYIGRPCGHRSGSKWHNPFVLGRHGNRREVVARFRAMLLGDAKLIAQCRAELRGKILACWCAPLPCHGDILLAIANSHEEVTHAD